MSIMHELDGMGSVSNAFTTHEVTGYHIKAGKTYLDQSLDLLADIYKNALLAPDEIERERSVIVEELHKDRDTPTLYIWWVWEHLLYGDQPAGLDVIGEEKTIRALKQSEFADYFANQYVAGNTVIVVAGNFDEPATVARVQELFSDIRQAPPKWEKPPIVEQQTEPRLLIEYKETDQTHIALGFRGYDANHPKRYAAEILATLLGGSWSSRMWDRIREKLGLAYTVWSSHESYSNRGYLITYAGVDHANVEKTIRACLDEYRNICTTQIGEVELKRVKDYIRGTMLISLEQSNAVAGFVGMEEIVTGKPLTVDEVFAKLDAVTVTDICEAAADIIRPEKLNLAMIGPFKDIVPFEKILREWQ